MATVSYRSVLHKTHRYLAASLLLMSLALSAQSARAAEVIPSMGMTRTPENGDDTRLSYGLAVRSNIVPMVSAEVGIAYRKDQLFDGALESTQWPVTASLWFHPMPMMYVGGGAGYYNTTLHYPQTPLLASATSQEFGMHLGGGLTVPMIPGVASLDLNGRYVYMGDQKTDLPPNNFKADYWTTSLGVAFHF